MNHFRGHNLMIGMTGCGKTTLLKKHIIPRFKAAGIKSAVLDPLGDPSFNADYQTKSSSEFLKFAYREKGYILIIDESGQAIGKYNAPMNALATNVRHKGNFSFFATHSVTSLPPIVRGQCANVYLFQCSRKNFELVADDFDQPTILKLPKLDVGEFYFVPRFGKVVRGKIDFKSGEVYYTPT